MKNAIKTTNAMLDRKLSKFEWYTTWAIIIVAGVAFAWKFF